MNKDPRYYDKDELFSRRAYLNFSISERGLGKTTCAKFWCIDDFLKTKKRFVWVRRYGTEIYGDKRKGLKGCANDFFEKIKKFYPEHKFEVDSGKCLIDGEVAGEFVALSTSSALKGVDFPNVNKLIFDEFLIPPSSKYSYLPDEVEAFLDLLSTIYRPITDTDGKEERTWVWLLANSITFANDYFYYFNIKPFKGRFYHDKKRGICVEQCKNEIYREAVKKTSFGKLVAGTKYEDYAIENKYLLDNNDFIQKKSPLAEYVFNIRYENREWAVYADNNLVYISDKVDRSRMFFTFTKPDHSLDSILIKSARGTRFDMLVRHYQLGLVRFENIMIKQKFIDFMGIFMVR